MTSREPRSRRKRLSCVWLPPAPLFLLLCHSIYPLIKAHHIPKQTVLFSSPLAIAKNVDVCILWCLLLVSHSAQSSHPQRQAKQHPNFRKHCAWKYGMSVFTQTPFQCHSIQLNSLLPGESQNKKGPEIEEQKHQKKEFKQLFVYSNRKLSGKKYLTSKCLFCERFSTIFAEV